MSEAKQKKKGPRCWEVIEAVCEAKRLARENGLWRTFHKLDEAEREVGYEAADILEGKQQ